MSLKKIISCPECGAIRIGRKRVKGYQWKDSSLTIQLILELINKFEILKLLFGELDFVDKFCPECESVLDKSKDDNCRLN